MCLLSIKRDIEIEFFLKLEVNYNGIALTCLYSIRKPKKDKIYCLIGKKAVD